jgi:putative pyruvate formate lyase activating enzyme
MPRQVMDAKIRRIDRALEDLEPQEAACALCPRDCRVDRRREAAGVCRTGPRAGVSAGLLHYGEEPVLSGDGSAGSGPGGTPRGSGTIFFAGCNLKCLFCQNHQISWEAKGEILSDEALAALMLDLQARGAYNINLVSPTHIVLPALRALRLAYAGGLRLPIVWNSNGYEKVEVLERLAGIVDVYLPDLKYFSPEAAKRYSGAADYFARASSAIPEMFVQRPDLVLDEAGLAREGLIIRHLVLPGRTADSLALLEWIAATLPADTALSLMSQYHPCFRAPEDIRRPLRAEEYRDVVERARALGLTQLFIQPELFAPDEHLVPDFERADPFRWRPKG